MASHVRSNIALVVAAVASGAASYATEGLPRLSHDVQAQLTAYLINPRLLLPGVWFGLVTGALAWRLGSRGLLGALISLAVTWIGWQLAVQAGIAAYDRVGTLTTAETARLVVSGMAAGAVGAFVVFLGVRASVAFPRTFVALLSTVAVGAGFGLLLLWSTTRQSAGLLLYATWQPAVVAIMALLARSRPAEPTG